MYFDGLGQSLATDPPQYTYHARNALLYGDWDPFDYPRWAVYQHSLTSFVGYLWMSLTEVSLRQSNMAGILLSFGALVFILLGLSRHHRPWLLAAVAFAYVINVTLLTHSRLSYLENGLLFWVGAMFWVYSWWGHQRVGVAVAGSIAAAAMFTGKLFGALLLPALLLAVLSGSGQSKRKHAVYAGASFAVAAVLLGFALYGARLSAVFAYTGEQSYGLRGFPDGLETPWAFLEHLVSYGFDNRLFYLNPELLLMIVVGGLLFLQFRLDTDRLAPTTRLALFWGLCTFVGLMPLNYSPIRYALIILPAIIIFCLALFEQTTAARPRPPETQGRWSIVLLVAILWAAFFHIAANALYFNTFPRPIRAMVWISCLVAVAVAWFAFPLLRRQSNHGNRRAWIVTLAIVLAATATINALRIHRFHIKEEVYSIAEANVDLDAILGPGAVVSGPYGPLLTYDTDRQSFIHLFQVAEVDSTLFERQPVTHLALDPSNYDEALKNYPQMAGLQPVSRYWVRDVEVGLYRIDSLFNNPVARAYTPTPFEEATALHRVGRFAEAMEILEPFYAEHPESKSVGLLLADVCVKTDRLDRVYALLTDLAGRFPTDFWVQLQAGRFILTLALRGQDRLMMLTAQRYFERAVAVDPYRAQLAMSTWAQINAQAGNPVKTAR